MQPPCKTLTIHLRSEFIRAPLETLKGIKKQIRKEMKIEHFRPFIGQHCETTATGNLLHQIGIEFSEPMLFGIGQGLGYLFWKMKTLKFPFIGGRVKTDLY